jgi:hypothetical protein
MTWGLNIMDEFTAQGTVQIIYPVYEKEPAHRTALSQINYLPITIPLDIL